MEKRIEPVQYQDRDHYRLNTPTLRSDNESGDRQTLSSNHDWGATTCELCSMAPSPCLPRLGMQGSASYELVARSSLVSRLFIASPLDYQKKRRK
jgi:hypothetical protein